MLFEEQGGTVAAIELAKLVNIRMLPHQLALFARSFSQFTFDPSSYTLE